MSEGFGEIKLVPRREIDLDKWEKLVGESANAIFMSHWYLDSVMENWSAFVLNDYELAFPIKISKKAGFNYTLQPLFIRAFTVLGQSQKTSRFYAEILKRFNFLQLNVTENEPVSNLEMAKFSAVYQFLPFEEEYEQLRKNYSENTRRKLKDFNKSNAQFTTIQDVSLLINLFKKEKGEQFEHLTVDAYRRLEKLMKLALKFKAGFIEAIELEDELIAIGFFIRKGNQLLYLKGIVTGKGKKIGAMQALFDKVIQENQLSCEGLDFGGSSDLGLASFNKKFGASDRNYIILKQNKMPWPFKIWVNRKLGI
jgi:hypothetical protein